MLKITDACEQIYGAGTCICLKTGNLAGCYYGAYFDTSEMGPRQPKRKDPLEDKIVALHRQSDAASGAKAARLRREAHILQGRKQP